MTRVLRNYFFFFCCCLDTSFTLAGKGEENQSWTAAERRGTGGVNKSEKSVLDLVCSLYNPINRKVSPTTTATATTSSYKYSPCIIELPIALSAKDPLPVDIPRTWIYTASLPKQDTAGRFGTLSLLAINRIYTTRHKRLETILLLFN
jgi:hypothetical protein